MSRTLDGYLKQLPIFELSIPGPSQAGQESHRVHANIYAAIVDGDPAAARDAMRQHMQAAYRALTEVVRTVPTLDGARTTSPAMSTP